MDISRWEDSVASCLSECPWSSVGDNEYEASCRYCLMSSSLYRLRKSGFGSWASSARISSGHVYYLDELGENLHYDLLFYYLNVFLFNSEKSQLIITSQETALLAQDIINDNRGVVWFAEKNKSTASSEYSRGDSFGLHKNLSLYNSYRIGRLGAKPELGSIFVELEN